MDKHLRRLVRDVVWSLNKYLGINLDEMERFRNRAEILADECKTPESKEDLQNDTQQTNNAIALLKEISERYVPYEDNYGDKKFQWFSDWLVRVNAVIAQQH